MNKLDNRDKLHQLLDMVHDKHLTVIGKLLRFFVEQGDKPFSSPETKIKKG